MVGRCLKRVVLACVIGSSVVTSPARAAETIDVGSRVPVLVCRQYHFCTIQLPAGEVVRDPGDAVVADSRWDVRLTTIGTLDHVSVVVIVKVLTKEPSSTELFVTTAAEGGAYRVPLTSDPHAFGPSDVIFRHLVRTGSARIVAPASSPGARTTSIASPAPTPSPAVNRPRRRGRQREDAPSSAPSSVPVSAPSPTPIPSPVALHVEASPSPAAAGRVVVSSSTAARTAASPAPMGRSSAAPAVLRAPIVRPRPTPLSPLPAQRSAIALAPSPSPSPAVVVVASAHLRAAPRSPAPRSVARSHEAPRAAQRRSVGRTSSPSPAPRETGVIGFASAGTPRAVCSGPSTGGASLTVVHSWPSSFRPAGMFSDGGTLCVRWPPDLERPVPWAVAEDGRLDFIDGWSYREADRVFIIPTSATIVQLVAGDRSVTVRRT